MTVRVVDPKTGKEKVVCGANLRDGKICMRLPIKGRERCKYHGGKVPRGERAAHFTTGKYSKELRRDILDNYYRSLDSGSQLDQSHEIALYDARIALLLRQATGGREITEVLVELLTIKNELAEWVEPPEENAEVASAPKFSKLAVQSIISRIDDVLEEFKNERRKWEEIYQVIENRRKLIESERKAIVDSQRMMTEQQALVLMAALVNIIRKHVDDPDTRNAIAAELVSIGTLPASQRITDQSVSLSADQVRAVA